MLPKRADQKTPNNILVITEGSTINPPPAYKPPVVGSKISQIWAAADSSDRSTRGG